MYVLLVIISLLSGTQEVRASVVKGPTAHQMCLESLPFSVKLYEDGKFHDGPPKENIKKVTGTCVPAP